MRNAEGHTRFVGVGVIGVGAILQGEGGGMSHKAYVGFGHFSRRRCCEVAWSAQVLGFTRGDGVDFRRFHQVDLYEAGGVVKVGQVYCSVKFIDDRVATTSSTQVVQRSARAATTVYHGDEGRRRVRDRAPTNSDDDEPLGQRDVATRFGRQARIAHAAKRAAETARGRVRSRSARPPPAPAPRSSSTHRDGDDDAARQKRKEARRKARVAAKRAAAAGDAFDDGVKTSEGASGADRSDSEEAARQRRKAERRRAREARRAAAEAEDRPSGRGDGQDEEEEDEDAARQRRKAERRRAKEARRAAAAAEDDTGARGSDSGRGSSRGADGRRGSDTNESKKSGHKQPSGSARSRARE